MKSALAILQTTRAPIAVAALFCLCSCAGGQPVSRDEEMVAFPARVVKVESFKHGESPSGSSTASVFGLAGYLTYQASLQSTWYTLAIPEHEDIGIESSGWFTVGQCVRVLVRKANSDNTKLYPGISRLEPFAGCQP